MKYYYALLLFAMPCFGYAQIQLGKDTDEHRWVYGVELDKMTSDTTYIAEVVAKETLDLGWPHKPLKATLITSSNSAQTVLALEVDADFVHDENNAGKVLMRLDNNKAFQVDYVTKPGAGFISLTDGINLIEQLRNASVILIQADFTTAGGKVMEFDATKLSYKKFKNKGLGAPSSNWSYDMQVDKMTSDTTYTATCDIKEPLVLSSNMNKGTDVIFGVLYKQGQNVFVVVVGDGDYAYNQNTLAGRIRFDDGPAIEIKCNETGDPKQMSIANSDVMTEKLKKAKRILVEIPFKQDGTKVLEFDTHGLVWNHINKK